MSGLQSYSSTCECLQNGSHAYLMAPGGWWSGSPGMSRDRKEDVRYLPSRLSNGVSVLVFTLRAGGRARSDASAVKIEVCRGLKAA